MILLTAFLLMNAFDRMLLPTLSASVASERRSSSSSSSSRVESTTELTPIGKLLSRLTLPPFTSFRRLQRGFYTGYPDYDRRAPPLLTHTTTPVPQTLDAAASEGQQQRRRDSQFAPIVEHAASNDDYSQYDEEDDDSTDGLEVDESVLRPVRYKLTHKKYRVLHDQIDGSDTLQDRRTSEDEYLRAQDVIDYMKKRRIEYVYEPMESSAEYRELRRRIPDHMFQKLNRHLKPPQTRSPSKRRNHRIPL